MLGTRQLLLAVTALLAFAGCIPDATEGSSSPVSSTPTPTPTPTPEPSSTFVSYQRGRVRSGPPATSAPISLSEVLDATRRAGPLGVTVGVRAVMPEAIAETRPNRRFSGEGILAGPEKRAGVTFDMSEIPNSAGFYGDVEGEMTVVYEDDRFTLTFPLLLDALAGEEDWVAYEVDDLSLDQSYDLGIGQLREVGLGAPQLALALLRGGPTTPLSPVGGGKVERTRVSEYSFEADVATASKAANSSLGPLLKTLDSDLRVKDVPMRISVDGDGVVRRVSWKASYVPMPGVGEKLELEISVTLAPLMRASKVDRPAPNTVVVYEDQLSR